MTVRKVVLVYELCTRKIEMQSMRKKKNKRSIKYLRHDLQRILWGLVSIFMGKVA